MKKLEFVNNKKDEDIQRRILAIERSRDLCMVKLVESVHYEIYKEYEVVLLKIKSLVISEMVDTMVFGKEVYLLIDFSGSLCTKILLWFEYAWWKDWHY